MSVSNSDIKFFYTTPVYGQSVSDSSTSIGGYPSITEVNWSAVLDNRISNLFTQYRCIAVQNTNASDTATAVAFYMKQLSKNASSDVEIAIEQPVVDRTWSTTTSTGDAKTLIDSSLSGSFSDNILVGCAILVTSGVNSGHYSVVQSYTRSSGTIVVSPSFAASMVSGVAYTILPSPSSILASSTDAPADGNVRMSSFSAPATPAAALSINISNRAHGQDMYPSDVTYVWMRRSLTPNRPAFLGNSITLAMRYQNA